MGLSVAAGLAPVKINAVVRRGLNDHTVVDLARHFRGTGCIVRFIEYMDVGNTNGWQLGEVVPALALSGWRRRSRCHHLGEPAVLLQLPAPASQPRRKPVYLPVCRAGNRSASSSPGRRH